MALNHTIYEANFDDRNERVHDQEMSRAIIELFHGCMECGATLLKPHVVHIIIQFTQKELCHHVAKPSASNSHCLASLVFVEVRPNGASSPKTIPNRDTLRMCLFFDNLKWVGSLNPKCGYFDS